MHSTPVSKARPKTAEQLTHGLGVTHGAHGYAGWQGLQAGRGHGLALYLAQRLLVQLDLDVDVAAPVVPVNLCRAAGQAEGGHIA